ncbi:MAG: ATP-binding protein [Nitrospirota bacterium]|nr:ATP-binding protein [Nitrospirota bacterium]
MQSNDRINEHINSEPAEPQVLPADIKADEMASGNAKRDWDIIFNSISDFVSVHSRDFRILRANKALADFVGLKPEELEGKHCYDVFHYNEGPLPDCPNTKTIKLKKPVTEELWLANPGIAVLVSTSPVFDDNGEIAAIVHIARDITEQKRKEEENRRLQSQLLQLQKLESVGRLASGIAHDFNNILTVILGYSELALLNLPENTPSKEHVTIIRDSAEKAASLTRQLLAFSRKQKLELKIVSLSDIIQNTIKMLGRMLGEDVVLELKLRTSRTILADPGQIGQVMMNLSVNARDAMPCGGRLVIETEDMDLDERSAPAQEGVRPGSYVILTVTDNGAGMSREVKERIFEPFFTTKAPGKGTGLGLSTVYGIIRQHEGHIRVYSSPGRGTTFRIYLPIAKGDIELKYRYMSETMKKGTETLLVVDDDQSVRKVIIDTMVPLGYRILEAASGDEALEIVDTVHGRIDLLLTDVVMPGMSGRELAEKIKSRQPGIKVIFMSGYPDDAVSAYGISRLWGTFIEKPLILSRLANKLRDLLDNKK